MKTIKYEREYSFIENNNVKKTTKTYNISIIPKEHKKLGIMLVGIGGNNGTTLVSSIFAKKNKLTWNNKNGEHDVKFLGSISQFGSVILGHDENNKSHSKLFKNIGDMYDPENLVIGGWDICKDNLYEATKKAKVIDYDLVRKLEKYLKNIIPLPSVYNGDFIASNQKDRVNNVIDQKTNKEILKHLSDDIKKFKIENKIDNVIVVWTASTERFNNGNWKNKEELHEAVIKNDKEVSPSILFALAAAENNCIFINGSPQNTLCPSVIDNAKFYNTFVGGEDFKTGQTKLKSALVDWLSLSGIRPLSIMSYNHLGNNDGKNLDETPQFKSKEITKKNVIDDVIEENPFLFEKKPDHEVVIKYIPAVGDSKRAIDEYYSELFLDGRHTLSLYNVCEDSLLAVPVILDIILFSEFFSRIKITEENKEHEFNPILSFLSFFFKNPTVKKEEILVNAFFKQRYGLENFFRILLELPANDFTFLEKKY
jgi:myo-inositol-1-phosphate synthase